MTPLLVVQNNLITRLTEPLARHARSRGHDVLDFSYTGPNALRLSSETIKNNHPILVYGSVGFTREWAMRCYGLSKWIVWNDSTLQPNTWANVYGYDFVNEDGGAWRLSALLQMPSWREAHVRPIRNDKSFNGGVYTKDALKALKLDENEFVFAAPVKEVLAEFRVWMLGGKPVTCSQYRADGEIATTTSGLMVEEAMSYAEHVHDTASRSWAAPVFYVMDVGLVRDQFNENPSWKMIELNSFNTSGWYAADPGLIYDAYMDFFADK